MDGHKYEPFEEAVIEVPEEHVGPVVDMLGQRKGQMMDLVAGTDTTSLTGDPYSPAPPPPCLPSLHASCLAGMPCLLLMSLQVPFPTRKQELIVTILFS